MNDEMRESARRKNEALERETAEGRLRAIEEMLERMNRQLGALISRTGDATLKEPAQSQPHPVILDRLEEIAEALETQARTDSGASSHAVLEAQLKIQEYLLDLLEQRPLLDALERQSTETRDAVRRVEEGGTYVQGLIAKMTRSTSDLNGGVETLRKVTHSLGTELMPAMTTLSEHATTIDTTATTLKRQSDTLDKTTTRLEKTIPSIEALGPKMNWGWLQRAGAAAVALFLMTLAALVFLTTPMLDLVLDTEAKIEMLPDTHEQKIQEHDQTQKRYRMLPPDKQRLVGEAMKWPVPEDTPEPSGGDATPKDVSGEKGEKNETTR